MSFDLLERSLDSGQPVLLFEMSRTGRTWRYTNIDKDLVYGGNTYTGLPIVDGGIAQDGGAEADEYRLTMPADAEFCQYLDAVNTSFTITLRASKAHLAESSSEPGEYADPVSGDVRLMWAGNLTTVNRPAQNIRELSFATLASSMKRGGLRLSWSRNCNLMLYGRGCLVNKATYATTLTAPTVVDGITLSSAAADALPDGWFSGGFVEWQWESGLIERTAIETHVGAVLTLLGSTQGMQHAIDEAAGSFIAYPGCNRTPGVCHTKFGNSANFGGVEYMQGKSPFSGEPVF